MGINASTNYKVRMTERALHLVCCFCANADIPCIGMSDIRLRPSHMGNCPRLRSGIWSFAESSGLGFARPLRMRRPSEAKADGGTFAACEKLRRNRTSYFVLRTLYFVIGPSPLAFYLS